MAVKINIQTTFDERALNRAQKKLADLERQAVKISGTMGGSFVRAGDRMSSFGSKLDRVGSKMSSAGRSMTMGITAPLAAAGALSLRAADQFERSMATMGVLALRAGTDMTGYRETVLEASDALGTMQVQTADTYRYILSSGLAGKQAVTALNASLKAQVIGMGESVSIADYATGVIGAYGQKEMDAMRAVDALTASVRLGKGEPAEYATALGKVTGTAAVLGISLEDTLGAVSKLSYTMSVSEGVTALNQALVSVLKPTQQTADALDSVGLSAEDVRESLGSEGILGTMKMLDKAFGGNRVELGKVFGSVRGLKAAYALLGGDMKNTEAIFKGVADSTGDLNEAFGQIDQEKYRIFDRMKSALSGAAIALGEQLIPVLAPAVEWIGSLAESFGQLDEGTQKWIIYIGLAAASVGPLLVVTGTLVSAVGNTAKGFGWAATKIGLHAAATTADTLAVGSNTTALGAQGAAARGAGAGLAAAAGSVALVAAAAIASSYAVYRAVGAYQEWKAAAKQAGEAHEALLANLHHANKGHKMVARGLEQVIDAEGNVLLVFSNEARAIGITTDAMREQMAAYKALQNLLKPKKDKPKQPKPSIMNIGPNEAQKADVQLRAYYERLFNTTKVAIQEQQAWIKDKTYEFNRFGTVQGKPMSDLGFEQWKTEMADGLDELVAKRDGFEKQMNRPMTLDKWSKSGRTARENFTRDLSLPTFTKVGTQAGANTVAGMLATASRAGAAGASIAQAAKAGVGRVSAFPAGVDFTRGYLNAINSGKVQAMNAGAALAAAALHGLNKKQGTGSPARVPRKSGGWFTEGYALGILDTEQFAVGAASQVAGAAMGALGMGEWSGFQVPRLTSAGGTHAFAGGYGAASSSSHHTPRIAPPAPATSQPIVVNVNVQLRGGVIGTADEVGAYVAGGVKKALDHKTRELYRAAGVAL